MVNTIINYEGIYDMLSNIQKLRWGMNCFFFLYFNVGLVDPIFVSYDKERINQPKKNISLSKDTINEK
jgi:hypothetical protein